jgi:hypothetical protein
MEKEVETAREIVNPDVSGGFHSYKEAVYNILGDFFGWLSTHQGFALALIIIVVGIMVWLILRAKNLGKQVRNEVYLKKKEIGKKDALIEEQENKLANLQKKLADQQGVVSEALLRTIKSLTGYDADQLPIFFKTLTRISENPLQTADQQATFFESQQFEEEGDDSTGTNDSEEKFASSEDVTENNDAKEEILSRDDSSAGSDVEEKWASGGDSSEKSETAERLVSYDDASVKDIAKKEIESGDESSEENGAKKENFASENDPEEASDTKKL